MVCQWIFEHNGPFPYFFFFKTRLIVSEMQIEYSSEQKLIFAFDVECRITRNFSHGFLKSRFVAHGFLLISVGYHPQSLPASRKLEFVPKS